MQAVGGGGLHRHTSIVTLGPALPPASAVTPASKVVARALWTGGSPGPRTSPPRSCMLSTPSCSATALRPLTATDKDATELHHELVRGPMRRGREAWRSP